MDAPAVGWLVRLVLDALTRDEPVSPQALQFLLRCYAATGDDEVGDAVGAALGRALAEDAGPSTNALARRAELVAEACRLADDERLRLAAGDLVDRLRQRWPHENESGVGASMRAIDACLLCLPIVPLPGLAAAAVDELERVVGLVYRPGGGVRHAIGGEPAGDLVDHALMARALLTAYGVTARVPYAMLADELMHTARRRWWDDARGGYDARADPAGEAAWFAASCEAVCVQCRLARLHGDPEFRRTAIVRDDCDHAADARRTLVRLEAMAEGFGLAAVDYGLAVDEARTVL